MLTRRVIPCLDIKEGRTVKGINFGNLKDAGDPVELAAYYSECGADELVFLDISASSEKRSLLIDLIQEIAKNISIPFTVGGGIRSVSDAEELLRAGADKVSINSSALKDPLLITEISRGFGRQFVIVAIDAKPNSKGVWEVYSHGGKYNTQRELISWAKESEKRGAGEILFTSIAHDGTQKGFAVDITKQVNQELSIPLIASGGAGNPLHFVDLFNKNAADAALAASIIHNKTWGVKELKEILRQENIDVRI